MSTTPIGDALIRIRIDAAQAKSTQEQMKEDGDPVGKRPTKEPDPEKEAQERVVEAVEQGAKTILDAAARATGLSPIIEVGRTVGAAVSKATSQASSAASTGAKITAATGGQAAPAAEAAAASKVVTGGSLMQSAAGALKTGGAIGAVAAAVAVSSKLLFDAAPAIKGTVEGISGERLDWYFDEDGGLIPGISIAETVSPGLLLGRAVTVGMEKAKAAWKAPNEALRLTVLPELLGRRQTMNVGQALDVGFKTFDIADAQQRAARGIERFMKESAARGKASFLRKAGFDFDGFELETLR